MTSVKSLLVGRNSFVLNRQRHYATAGRSMRAWVCEEYKKPLVCRHISVPEIRSPDQVLIKVDAASVNPIDVRMSEGYANELMSAMYKFENRQFLTSDYHRLPLVAGRDFCGQVAQVGASVHGFVPGDRVIGVVPASWQGSYAEYVLTTKDCLAIKPQTVDELNAAAMVYTHATIWSALKMARVPTRNAKGRRFLIHGGSGGIGTTAIQLLREWNADKIVATCSEKNMELVEKLGAKPIDYNALDAKEKLTKEAPFDVILDCAQSRLTEWSDNLLGVWRDSVHLSLVSPLMTNTDRYGLPVGLLTTAGQLLCRNLENFTRGRLYMYSYFWPDRDALAHLSTLIDKGKLNPVVEKVYSFNELPSAYSKVGQLHSRGKSVIDFSKIASEI